MGKVRIEIIDPFNAVGLLYSKHDLLWTIYLLRSFYEKSTCIASYFVSMKKNEYINQ